jgi:two-component system response regulator MprA
LPVKMILARGGLMEQRILVVDDDPKINNVLRRSLSYEGYEVYTAFSGEEALRKALQHDPELVVLDVMMPGLDGIEVCRRLRSGGDVAILMLTAKDEIKDRVNGLDAGADDYLVKPFSLDELMARVRALLRRKSSTSVVGNEPAVYRFADLFLNEETRECHRNHRQIQLTAKEFDLLLTFMRNPNKVLHRDIVMEIVWGYDFEGESNVLEVYIALLRQKLEEGGESRIIHTVRGVGYVLKEVGT